MTQKEAYILKTFEDIIALISRGSNILQEKKIDRTSLVKALDVLTENLKQVEEIVQQKDGVNGKDGIDGKSLTFEDLTEEQLLKIAELASSYIEIPLIEKQKEFTQEDKEALIQETLSRIEKPKIINQTTEVYNELTQAQKIEIIDIIISNIESSYPQINEIARSLEDLPETEKLNPEKVFLKSDLQKAIRKLQIKPTLSIPPQTGGTGGTTNHAALTNLQWSTAGHTIDTNIDLNSNSLNEVNSVQFITTPTPLTPAEGLLQWNSTENTIDVGLEGGIVTGQLFEEMFERGVNKTGSTLLEGKVVYSTGRLGNKPKFDYARSDSESTSRIVGVLTMDIPDNGFGRATTSGLVRQIKTDYTGTGVWGNTWVEGDYLYVSKTVAGQLTNIEPSAPHHSDIVGQVSLVGGAGIGSILVNINRHQTLQGLTDVNGTPLATTGQIPVWDQANQFFDFNYNITNYLSTSSVINDLSDVTIAAPVDGQVLTYDSGTSTWINEPSTGFASNSIQIDAAGLNNPNYGALSGSINGSNALFTVSLGSYIPGSLIVSRNGVILTQGTAEGYIETNYTNGTFTLTVAPLVGDQIIASYVSATTALSGNADTVDGLHSSAFISSLSSGEATLDFTALGNVTSSITINNSNITESSNIVVSVKCRDTGNNRADEILVQPLEVKATNLTTGACDLVVNSLLGKFYYELTISYIIF